MLFNNDFEKKLLVTLAFRESLYREPHKVINYSISDSILEIRGILG